MVVPAYMNDWYEHNRAGADKARLSGSHSVLLDICLEHSLERCALYLVALMASD